MRPFGSVFGPQTKLCELASYGQPVGIDCGRPKGQLTPKGRPAVTSERPQPVRASSPAAGACVAFEPTVSDGDTDLLLLPHPATSAESPATTTNVRISSRFIEPPWSW